MLTRLIVITLQYIQLSNNYVIYLSMFMSIISQKRVQKHTHAIMGTSYVKAYILKQWGKDGLWTI